MGRRTKNVFVFASLSDRIWVLFLHLFSERDNSQGQLTLYWIRINNLENICFQLTEPNCKRRYIAKTHQRRAFTWEILNQCSSLHLQYTHYTHIIITYYEGNIFIFWLAFNIVHYYIVLFTLNTDPLHFSICKM